MRGYRQAIHLSAVLAASACGGGGGGSGSQLSVADYFAGIFDLQCEGAVQCGNYPDKASCLSSGYQTVPQVTADIAAGKRTFDSAAAAKCLAALRAAPATCSTSAVAPTDPSCTEVFKGTLAAGAACADGGQCQSGSCAIASCTTTPACCMGTCDPVTAPIALGGACMSTGSCVSGLFCRGATATDAGVCAEPIPAGQACAGTDLCAVGTFCQNAVCAALPAEGAPCMGACDDRADFCDGATTTCLRKKAVGEACPNGARCIDLARCDLTSMTCVARGKAGDACDQVDACLGALQCTDGACTLPALPDACP